MKGKIFSVFHKVYLFPKHTHAEFTAAGIPKGIPAFFRGVPGIRRTRILLTIAGACSDSSYDRWGVLGFFLRSLLSPDFLIEMDSGRNPGIKANASLLQKNSGHLAG
ncbi:hypothetical protein [Paenibacillus jiagnxiensis]|uniref:hypothetical protein n=1 Tax=Paenibacillus jiagnxiensis TaxID=3228926 RepID=UPI0033A0B2E9